VTLKQLEGLAVRKLGKGATVRVTREGWVAERVGGAGRSRVTAKTRDILAWFLEQMPNMSARSDVDNG
jgi:hypothetical protein